MRINASNSPDADVAKTRVLHVIGGLGLGGAQSLLYQLWPSLCAASNYEFELCVLGSLGHFGEQLVAEGATVHELSIKRKYNPTAVLKLRHLIRAGSYKIVHAHLFPELPIVSMATAGLKNVKALYTEHGPNNRRRGLGPIARTLDRMAYNNYARVVAVNNSTRTNLVSWLPELKQKSVVIRNSVRLSTPAAATSAQKGRLLDELRLPANNPLQLILFAGRLTSVKGVDVLLRALAELQRSDYLCLIAGDGPELSALRELTTALRLDDRVRFLGLRDDVTTLLKQVDMLALPSRREGLPLIVLEAMAARCPIVASAVDGTAEVLRHEHSALLVEPNQPKALAGAISQLMDSPTLRRNLSASALQEVSAYGSDEAAKRLLSLYDDVMLENTV
jgi:glycosyltransferase involved in cell wall biosynthesis